MDQKRKKIICIVEAVGYINLPLQNMYLSQDVLVHTPDWRRNKSGPIGVYHVIHHGLCSTPAM